MATAPTTTTSTRNGYPTTDGKPMAETDHHRILMTDLIDTLQIRHASEPRVYVSGNLIVCYERGNRRKHVSPDVFLVRGVPKRRRINYLIWEEGRGPQVVIEITSSSTRSEDQKTKKRLYQDVLKVREYFLFDPFGDYLEPRLQGYRLRGGVYRPIRVVGRRLPSQVLGLHLEARGDTLRLWDPTTQTVLPTREERETEARQARQQAEEGREQERQARQQAEEGREQERQARLQAEQQLAEALAELERIRHRPPANGHP
jgi:Uma2 family endonuclease